MSWKYSSKDLMVICLTIITIVFINTYFKKPPSIHQLYNQAIKQCNQLSKEQKYSCRYTVTEFYKERK